MTTAENLINLLKQTIDLALKEFADDQRLVEASSRGDRVAIEKAKNAAKTDREKIIATHETAQALFTSWERDSKRVGIAQTPDAATKLLHLLQDTLTDYALVEGRYEKVLTAFIALETSPQISSALLEQLFSAINEWRESALTLQNKLNNVSLQENTLVAHNAVFEGQLDPSRFTNIREFRSGGVAELELAHDTKTGKTVVLKTYRNFIPVDSTDADAIILAESAFANQLSTTARIDIPGIERTFGFYFGRSKYGKPVPVVVAEFIAGETLAQVRARGAANELYVRGVFDGVGLLIQKLLEHGIIHRDISPDNIIVRERGAPTAFAVIDFHSAVSAPEGKTGTILGQNWFAPVELQKLGKADTSTPFFALGRVGLSLLVPSDTELGVIVVKTDGRDWSAQDDVPELLRRFTPPLSQQFIHTIERATSNEDRFRNWSDFSHCLSHWKPGQMTLRERLSNAKKVLGTSTGKWRAFIGALSGKTRVTQTTLVTSAAPVATEKPLALKVKSEEEQARLPTPPPLMPMNVIEVRTIPGYFEVETEHEVYRIHDKKTDGGTSKKQDEWVTYFQNLGDETRLPTPAEMLRITVALKQRLAVSKDQKEIEAATRLKAGLIDDFRNNLMMTGARIVHSKSKGDSVVQDYRQSDEKRQSVGQFWGPDEWLSKVKDGDMIAHSLFDASKEEVESAFKWLTTKDSYIWRMNSSYDGERPVVLGLGGRFGILAYYVGDVRPARGVAVRKKI